MAKTSSLYDELGVSARASDVEIRRAYRNLVTKTHPDRGGDPAAFKRIQQAYEILSDAKKRELYDTTGRVQKSVEEEFSDSFAGGSFRDRTLEEDMNRANISEQITVRQGPDAKSHTAGFEAWMRSRGEGATEVFTAETMAAKFGVVEGSYDAVPLPRLEAHIVRDGLAYGAARPIHLLAESEELRVVPVTCKAAGKPGDMLSVGTEPLPLALGWGEVLVNVRAAPVHPADLYTALMGGRYGPDQRDPPYVAGHDGIGVVMKVGAGVKGLAEGDWVLPFRAFQGTWRDLAVWKEKDALRIPPDCVPLEYAALLRELFTAYRLLEDHGNLKPGDCVILNAANSTVGQLVVQLCRLLQLRCVAVVRRHDDDGFDKVADWLKALGASEVIADQTSVKAELDKLKFFAKPKLALDAVGGVSAVRISEALSEGGVMVIYGCMCGKAPPFRWDNWVFREVQVKGFNLRRWMSKNRKRVAPMLDAIGKLINGDRLRIAYTEYDLATEFGEALDHAQDAAKNTKILLRSPAIDLTTA